MPEDDKADPLNGIDFSPMAGIPAVFASAVNAATGPAFMRLTFGEELPGVGVVYRMAAVLPLESAIGLVDLIEQQLANQGIVRGATAAAPVATPEPPAE